VSLLAAALGCATPAPPAPPPPTREERAATAVAAALSAIDERTRAPDTLFRLDVPIALAGLRDLRPGDAGIEALLARAVTVLDTGGDPRRRAWDPAASWPADQDYTWTPVPGKVVSPNLALVEVLYCTQHPLRPETVEWVCATLRDGGGRQSGHAAWYLDLAVDQGCVARERTCLDALRDELLAAGARPTDLASTDARDLLAEQVLFGARAGASHAALAPAVDALLAVQGADGSFGAPGDTTFPALHATLAAAWGLETWRATP
jgi:hypothetical protein